MIGIDIADQIEALKTVLICATPFSIGVVLILWKEVEAACVVFKTRECVLCLPGKPTSSVTAEGEIQSVQECAAAGFNLLYLTEARVGARVIGSQARVWWKDG